jgi:hypothetical protein
VKSFKVPATGENVEEVITKKGSFFVSELKSQGWFCEVEKVAALRIGLDASKPIIQYRSETGMVGLVSFL